MSITKQIRLGSQPITGVSNIHIVLTKDRSLDFGRFEVPISTDLTKAAMLNDFVIELDDGTDELVFQDLIIASSKRVPINRRGTRFRMQHTLIERTKIAEYHFVTRQFTQPVTGPKKSLFDVIDELRQTVPLATEHTIDTTRIFEMGPSTGFLQDIEAPEFFFNEKTLRECLDEILDEVDAVARFVRIQGSLDPLEPPRYPYNRLFVDFVNERQSLVDKDADTEYFEDVQDLDQYATKVESVVSNLVNDASNIGGLVREPQENQYGGLRSDDAQFTESGLYFPATFGKRRRFQVMMKVPTVSAGVIEIDISDRVLEDAERLQLDYNGTIPNVHLGLYQSNTLTWDLKSKKIVGWYDSYENLVFPVGSRTVQENVIKAGLASYFKAQGDPDPATTAETQYTWALGTEPKAHELEIKTAYTAFFDAKIQAEKEHVGDFGRVATRQINQGSNVVSSVKALQALKTEAQNSGAPEFRTTKQHTKLAELFAIGDYTADGYICATIEIAIKRNSFIAKYLFSQNAQKKNLRLRVNSLNEIFDIPADDRTAQRFDYYSEYIIATFDNIAEDANHMLTDRGLEVFANTFKQQAADDRPPFYMLMRDDQMKIYRNPDGTYQPISSTQSIVRPIVPFGEGNSLNFVYAFDSPNIAGSQVILRDTSLFTQRPTIRAIQYTDEFGQLEDMDLRFVNSYNYPGKDNLPLVVSNPVLDEVLNPGTFKKFITGGDIESQNTALQVISAYPDNIIIGRSMIANNNLVEYYNGIYKTLYLISGDGTYGPNETKKGKEDHRIPAGADIDVIISNDGLFIRVNALTDDSWAIVDIDNNLYLACNQRNLDGSFNQRTVVWFKRKMQREDVLDAY